MSKETYPTSLEMFRAKKIGESAEKVENLRDYFAAKAMQGLVAQSCGTAAGSDPAHGAKYAYEMADAMLDARNNSHKPATD